MFILDTDALSHFMYGRQPMADRIRQASGEVVATIISRIEILRGRFQAILAAEDANKLLQAHDRLERSEAFLEDIHLLPLEAASAAAFDRLRQNKKLKKIGRGDLLIAAITVANRATLVSRNLKDFRQVPDLQVENWIDEA